MVKTVKKEKIQNGRDREHILNSCAKCISISMIVLHVKKLVEIGLIRMILIYL